VKGSSGQREQEVAQLRRHNEQLQARVVELEAENARLVAELAAARKHSGNSSKPPSSDIVKPAPKAGGRSSRRKIGGQPGHARHQRPLFAADQIDKRKFYGLEECPHCGSRDLDLLPDPAQVVQQVELLPKPFQVTEHVVQACRCRHCRRTQTGQLPAAIAATGLIGTRMMALLLFMKGAMRCSYSTMEEFLGHVLGLNVCRGYLAKVMARGSQALQSPVEELRSLLPSQPCLNVDETGHKENGKSLWTWCFRADNFVLFTIQASRGSGVLIEFLTQQFSGVLGCDYFSAYRKFMGLMNGTVQFCLAHLIRDLKFLADHPDIQMQLYSQPILRAIRRMFHLIHKHVNQPQKNFQLLLERQKQRIIAMAVNTASLSPVEWYVQKHYPEVINMAQRFRKHGKEYFTFITTPGIGPTNNVAEQALRFVVMDRRATQGTRSQNGRTFCERIWTVIGTCRINKRSIFNYLCQAVAAWAKGLPAPSLLQADSS
jgi:transposase